MVASASASFSAEKTFTWVFPIFLVGCGGGGQSVSLAFEELFLNVTYA